MDELLSNFYSNSSLPVLSAFILGLMMAISPCPLATNITAMGYVSKNLENRKRVFYNGLVYTLGRAFSYTLLAFFLFVGADQFKISGLFQQYGEKLLGPLLVVVGLFMLGVFSFNIPFLSGLTARFQDKSKFDFIDVFLLGVLFALAFCPYSGVLYFGMLIPMSIENASGLFLPMVFAVATAIPVLIFAWLLAFTIGGVGKFYKRLQAFEIWFRRIVAVVFLGIGVYYIIIVWF